MQLIGYNNTICRGVDASKAMTNRRFAHQGSMNRDIVWANSCH